MTGWAWTRALALLAIGMAAGAWFVATPSSAQTAPGPGAAASTTPGATRIGFVDIQRVLARSSAGVAAREQLEKEKAAMQKQVDAQRGELERLRDEIDKKGQLLSPEARREKQDQLERKVRDARRLVDDLQGTLQKKEEALLAKVLQDVGGLIQRIGKDKGYHIVLERQRSSILYASPDSDLTDDIIRAYDDETKRAPKK
jgi:outer membrane protein